LLLMREVKRKVSGPFRLHLIQDAARLSRVPGMRALLLLNFLFHFTVYGATPVASIYTMQLLEEGAPAGGLSVEGWVGAVAMTIYVSSIVSLPVWGWLLDRYDPPRMLAVVTATAFVGSLPLAIVQTPLQLAAARLFFGMCAAGVQPAVMRMIKTSAPEGMNARALYFGAMFQMLGNGLGPLAGGVIGPFFGLRAFFMVNAALLGAGLGTWLLRLRRMTG
jgi:DHA1 family multidrug resistance protein-like MFS transporter